MYETTIARFLLRLARALSGASLDPLHEYLEKYRSSMHLLAAGWCSLWFPAACWLLNSHNNLNGTLNLSQFGQFDLLSTDHPLNLSQFVTPFKNLAHNLGEASKQLNLFLFHLHRARKLHKVGPSMTKHRREGPEQWQARPVHS
jgi:hypothetical protein